jgi:hypothetical protein
LKAILAGQFLKPLSILGKNIEGAFFESENFDI